MFKKIKLFKKINKKTFFNLSIKQDLQSHWKKFMLVTGITGIATGVANSMGFFNKTHTQENERFENISEEAWHSAISREQLIIHEMAIDRTVGESDQLTVRNLVIKGGGPKGAAYPGALKELALKLNGLGSIERIAGASAGSIMAVLLAVGYTPEEIQEFLHEKDQGKPVLLRFALDGNDKFTDEYVEKLCQTLSNSRYPLLHIPVLLVTNPVQTTKLLYKLGEQRGICKGDYFENWLNKKVRAKIVDFLLAQPENTQSREILETQYQWPTLGQLQELVEQYGYQHFKHVYIVTATLGEGMAERTVYTSESIPVLENHLECELTHNPNVIIASAARISMSIPYVFIPAVLKIVDPKTKEQKQVGESLGIDGGVLENYPITVFDYNVYQRLPDPSLAPWARVPNPETLGLFLYDKKDLSFWSWLKYQTQVVLKRSDAVTPEKNPARRLKSSSFKDATLKDNPLPRHVEIDNCGVKLTEFDLSTEKSEALLASGKKGVDDYMLGGNRKKLENYYQQEQQRKKITLSNMKKQMGLYSNIDEYRVNEHYEVPQQFNLLMKQLKTQKLSELKLVIEGFGGTGKTELGHHLARRYMEACFWAQWSEGRFKRGDVINPVIWRWQAETAEGLWSSLAELMQQLNITFNETIRKRLPDENEKDYEKHITAIVEKTLNGLLPTLSHGYVLWLFDNAETFDRLETDNSLLPSFKAYWTKLPKQAFGFITTRNRHLLPIKPTFSLDMDDGMGVRAAMRLLENITGLSCSMEFVEQLDCLPLSLVLVGHYIREQQRYNPSFGYAQYLELLKTRKHETEKVGQQLVKGTNYEKALTQQAVLLQQVELLKNYPDNGESYQLMQFCSLLAAEHISQDLLEAFVHTSHPEWNQEKCQIALENSLRVLQTYSLLKQGQHHQNQPVFIQHRQIQTVTQTYLTEQASKIIFASMLNYIEQQKKQAQSNNSSFRASVALLQHLDSVFRYFQPEIVKSDCLKEWLSLINLTSDFYYDLGQYSTYLVYEEKALKVLIAHHGENSVETAKTLIGIGNAYYYLGDTDKAKKHYEMALQIQTDHYGEGHFETLRALGNLGMIYNDLGDFVKAKENYEKVLKREIEHYNEGHIETASTLSNLGGIHCEMGDAVNAKEYLEKALKILTSHYSEGHIETAHVLMNLGRTYKQLGDKIKAKEFLERALKIETEYYGDGYIWTACALMFLGGVYADLGNAEEAKRHLEKALTIRTKNYGEEHIWTGYVLMIFGDTYKSMRDNVSAKIYYEKAFHIFSKEKYYLAERVQKSFEELEQLEESNQKMNKTTEKTSFANTLRFFKAAPLTKEGNEKLLQLKQKTFSYNLQDEEDQLTLHATEKNTLHLLGSVLQTAFKEELATVNINDDALQLSFKNFEAAQSVVIWLEEQGLTLRDEQVSALEKK